MKGLMMKDVFTAKKILLVYFLMIVLFSFGGTQTMLFALIYALMLPVNMCSYDERSHFDRMMPALPLTGLQCVLDKYIITYICAAVMMVLSVGVTSARCGAWTIPENMLGSLAVMLVTHAIVMPAIIRFGVAKAQAVYLGAIIIEAALIALISRWDAMNMWMNIPFVEIGIFVFVLAINIASIFVSAKMFDLRAEQ